MTEGNLEGQPIAGYPNAAPSFGNNQNITEVNSFNAERPAIRNSSDFESTNDSFASGPEPASDILRSVKTDGFDKTFEDLADGSLSTSGKDNSHGEQGPREKEIVNFGSQEEKPEEPRRENDENMMKVNIEIAEKERKMMEELLRKLEESRRESERLRQELRKTQDELKKTTQSGVDIVQTTGNLVELGRKNDENDKFYKALIEKVRLKQAA